MVFKRPANSRDDRSARAPKRSFTGDDKAKKSTNSGADRSATENIGSKLKRNHYGDEAAGGRKKSFSSGKSYSGRAGSDDRPKRTFDNDGEKKSFKPRNTPYSGRPTSDDRPKRSYGGESGGEKREYKPRSAPYSGRPSSDDRPKRSYGGDSAGEKKDYKPRSTPYSGKPASDDRPKRSYGSEPGGEKRAYKPRNTSYSERPEGGDRPKRSFDDKPAGERRSPGYKGGERSGDKKFGSRGTAGGGFKKRDGDFKGKPFRNSENSSYNNKPVRSERSPEDRVMRSRKKTENDDSGLIRLNRYISNAGICSRRKADELIAAGVISVNGEVVSELGHKVDPMKDVIRYNGETLKREKMVYVLLNKPKDYITTTDDPQERRTVMQLVEKASRERIYPIGRLDRNTTGLLLMTNDGDLADKLSHPKNNVTKIYQVELSKSLTQGDLNKIAFGLELEDGLIKPDMVSYVQGGTKREVGIQIHSGKNRIVRRIFEHLGYEVVKLDRTVYANLTKKDLPRGRWRYLDEKELIQLKHLV
ncbi:pseudouridine synthase [Mucilaginibacter ginsenosidivorans]|uniref:Pseudouridine synthase n=1 Tax=Mucilaginibacter ginsenosidivorans TaxID=398053 RepID=A0A5B8UTN6_9SPHI|nr:pseudouridine synthase [Mucilaginibacter ginsenosidivorans]QEC62268.1 pseudouridine synthase [Mucilaginibacter ginsenosidivorans]